jgi:microcystin-dependent protein
MKNFILIIITILVLTTTTFADIPKTLNYQGRLMNAAGQPVIDGQYSVTFRLYTAASGGTMVWEEAQSVGSTNGYFNAMFAQPLWIGMQVGTAAEMTPRQQMGTSAYAMTVVDGGISTNKIENSAVTTDKIADGAITQAKMANSSAVPSGSIMMWPTENVPTGWLVCEGQELNKNEYSQLFTAIGIRYGESGDNFKLPDFRGYFVRGRDNKVGRDSDSSTRTDRGDGTTGDEVGTRQTDELKSHIHQFVMNQDEPKVRWAPQVHMGPNINASSGVVAPTGGDETRPKNIAMMYIIKK